jgi:hypothetical protein
MQVMEASAQARPVSLPVGVRNRYYFGKLLDVVHFDIEQDYFNAKRWLINRLVLGYGVVCGMDVQLRNSDKSVVVTTGFGIDRWGHEIIVPAESRPWDLPLPPPPPAPSTAAPATATPASSCEDDDCYYSLYICYYECASSPEPSLGDDCGQQNCVPSLIQERYKLEWRKGKAPDPPPDDCVSDLITGGRVNRRALALRVSQCCQDAPCDPCLPLANLRLAKPDGSTSADVDITIRPIVYTNDLLYELITAQSATGSTRPLGGK